MLDFVTREIEVECLPDRIPAKIQADISELRAGEHLEARDLPLPEGVQLVAEPGRVIASVAHTRAVAEGTVEGEELLETEAAQPELIRKRREEGEEEG